MKSNYLLPHVYKRVGWFITIPFLLLGLYMTFWGESVGAPAWLEKVFGEFLDELICIALIVGLLLVGFSREKTEDEYITKIRLESLQLSVLTNYALLIICVLVFYGMNFFSVMIYNMFTTLIIFVIRFNFIIYRNK